MRQEIGKEHVVQVHDDEGRANHIDPKPCVGLREEVGEASVGEQAGQPLSLEKNDLGRRRGCERGRQYGRARHASSRLARRGLRPWHVWKLVARELGGLMVDRGRRRKASAAVRVGKARSRSR